MVQISVNELLNLFGIVKDLIDKDPNEAGMSLYKVAESSLTMLDKKYAPEYYEKIITSKNTKFIIF
jgi:hypothetical protein